MNLQLFAQEKTERATPRKRQKARERGQVFSSREMVSSAVLLTGFAILNIFQSNIIGGLTAYLSSTWQQLLNKEDLYTIPEIQKIFVQAMMFISKIMAPLLSGIMLAGVLTNFLQTGAVLSLEPIIPKIERINPFEGLKRIFSRRSLMELLKSTAKIIVIGYLIYSSIYKIKDIIPLMLDMDVYSSFEMLTNISFNTGMKAGIALFILAVFDYVYQWYEYETGLMMSKEDIKEEFKEVEGNPQIKSRIRQIQRRMARSRMMHDVKKADVVITNPTHLAVALAYDASVNPAPVVLAKGSHGIAEKIKQIAEREDIPIVENKPLAQVLYKSVEIGDVVPENLYHAVAEVLAFVYSLKERRN
ncbi:MAG: flagellar biosynthesis protein FlhB [Tepidanaerobacteraceae bacterium]|jgi:flagellar biosynthetic protein FlhB|nr:flagellar biosynthesis protein FlhB [Tepidanaerobacteraceae bacterium]